MNELSQQTCEACRAGAPQVSDAERPALLQEIPEWAAIDGDDVMQLERIFAFANFVEALAFTNRVGDLAEANAHHPALLTEWGRVTVTWWTHKIKGLHHNDFIMAAKTDGLYSQGE